MSDQAHTTQGFGFTEPGDDDLECALCPTGIPHSVIDIKGADKWIAIPICIRCQVVTTTALAGDLAVANGLEPTPEGVSELMLKLNWVERDPIEGVDTPPMCGGQK